jgi:hypothetical protein
MQTTLPDPKKGQQRIELAEAGDPWPLFRALKADQNTALRWDAEFAPLVAALERRACEAPDLFSAEVLAQIMAAATFLFLRTQMHVTSQIQRADEQAGYSTAAGLSSYASTAIPRLLEIGRYLAEIAHIQAATARQWALARAKLPPTERPAKQPTQLACRTNGHLKSSASLPPSNGHSNGQTRGSDKGQPHLPGRAPANRLQGYGNGSPPPA